MRSGRLLLLVFIAAFTCTSLSAGEEEIRLADAPGRQVVTGSCITCHSLDYIPMNAPVMARGGWDKAVAKMIDKFGAPISQDNARLIVDYLEQNYSGQH